MMNLINGTKVLVKQFDMDFERKKIETDLIEEYGSATVY